MTTLDKPVAALLAAVRDAADRAGVFASAAVEGDRLVCPAANSAEPAEYRLFTDAGRIWVSLVTDNRWLSESIETDLLHTGDKIEDLIDEELVDLGCDRGPLPVEHFRSDDLLFTFRSPLPFEPAHADRPDAIDLATKVLLAYEAAFRPLGDMDDTGDDD